MFVQEGSSAHHELFSGIKPDFFEALTSDTPGLPGELYGGLQVFSRTPLEYYGTFGEVVDTVKDASADPAQKGRLLLATSRLVRVVIDEKIAKPELGIDFDQIRDAGQLALDLFTGSQETSAVDEFLERDGVKDIDRELVVIQKPDPTTAKATDPKLAVKAGQKASAHSREDGCLFLCICHGGLVSGASTFISSGFADRSDASLFYPVRLSMDKHGDTKPQLSEQEAERLRQEAEGRKVIVFDEDSFSGRTLRVAERYFDDLFGKRPSVIVAFDARHLVSQLKHRLGGLLPPKPCSDYFPTNREIVLPPKFFKNLDLNNLRNFRPTKRLSSNQRIPVPKTTIIFNQSTTPLSRETISIYAGSFAGTPFVGKTIPIQ